MSTGIVIAFAFVVITIVIIIKSEQRQHKTIWAILPLCRRLTEVHDNLGNDSVDHRIATGYQ